LAFARLSLAGALRPLGQPKRAAEVLDNAIAEFRQLHQALTDLPHLRENQALAVAKLGLEYHLAGRNQEAKSKLDEALQEFSQLADSPASCSRHFERLAYAGTVQGRILRDLGLDTAAENNLRSAVRLYVDQLLPPDPTSFQNRLGLATAGRHLGLLLDRAGQTDEAEREYAVAAESLEALLKEHPDDPYVRDDLSLCYEHLGDLARAARQAEKGREYFDKATEVRSRLSEEPDYLAHRIRLLLKYDDQNKCREAAGAAERLTGAVPNNAAFETLRALVHFRLGELQPCIERLEGIPENDWDAPRAEQQFLLAMAYHQRNGPGDLQQADQHFEQALEHTNRESSGDLNLIRLREEAAGLLGRTVERPAGRENRSPVDPAMNL
jgi:tetratricopeptide (TPR) repeat protein